MVHIYAEIDLHDLCDDELIGELESRGFGVFGPNLPSVEIDSKELIEEVVWRFKNGYIEDTIILLERLIPGLSGLSQHIRK